MSIFVPFILSRYIMGQFIRWFFVIIGLFTTFIMLFDFMEFMRKASYTSALGVSVILKMMLLKLPSFLEQLLPFTILFSTIITFWHLNRSHELEIIRTSERSLLQILRPIVVLILGFGLFDLCVLNALSARLMLRYEHLYDAHFKGNFGSLAISESGVWLRQNDQKTQSVLHIHKINCTDQTMQGITIFKYTLGDKFIERLDAASAHFEAGHLVLQNVWHLRPDHALKNLTNYQLQTALTFKSLQNQGADPQSLSFWSIPNYIQLLTTSGLSATPYRLHYHFLMTRILWLVIMLLLGVLCSLRPLRQQKTGILIVGSLMAAFFVYFLKDIAYALGAAGRLPVILATWFPVVIGMFLSFASLLHVEER